MNTKRAGRAARLKHVLGAAQQVFSRYGYARTTMADVAQSAGVSRPALYLLFPGKGELFSAVIRLMNEEAFQDIHAGLGACDTLEEKLTFAFERWIAQPYDLAYTSPDARDLFDYAFPAMQEVAAEFQAFLAGLLREMVPSPLGVTPEALAQTLLFSVHGFKAVAKDGADLRRMIAVQIWLVVATLASLA